MTKNNHLLTTILVIFLALTFIVSLSGPKMTGAVIGAEEASLAMLPYVEPKVTEEAQLNEEINIIVKLKEPAPSAINIFLSAEDRIEATEEKVIDQTSELEVSQTFDTFAGFAGTATAEAIEDLQNNPNVEAVYYDELISVTLDSSIPQVNADDAWTMQINSENITGKGQTVCVVDTGVNYTHATLGGCTTDSFLAGTCGKVLDGYDFVICDEYGGDGTCIPEKVRSPDSNPMDDNGHGTHVAGIVASTDSTYRGIAPEANVVVAKVMNKGGVELGSRVIAGIEWCIGNASKYNITSITLSLTGSTIYSGSCDSNSSVANMSSYAALRGILVAAASGNLGSSAGINSPSCGSRVTSSGTVDGSDNIWSGTNVGPNLDLYAPGTSICSSRLSTDVSGSVCGGGLFIEKTGTSMAAPHVAGAALLLQQYEKAETGNVLTPSQIEEVLKNSGINITGRGYTVPRIDILVAIRAIDNTPASQIADLNNVYSGFSNTTINWTNPLEPDFNHIEIWVNGEFKGNVSKPDNSYTITSLLANHTYELQAKSVDNSGNANNNFIGINITTQADAEAPVISLVSPLNNSKIAQGMQISLSASDNGEVSALWYSLNNGTSQLLNSPYLIETSSWIFGNYSVAVWANDTGNNIGTSGFFFMLNSSAPSASNVQVNPSSPITTDDLTCNYTYADAENNPESADTIIKWYIDGSSNSILDNLTQIPNSETSRGQKWNCSVIPHDGTFYGATSTSSEVTIQNAAPAVTVSSPNGGETLANTTSITWSSSDIDNDTLYYFVSYSSNSGSSWTELSNCANITTLICSWNTSAVSDGTAYRIKAEARDALGASSSDQSDNNFKVNNTVTTSNGTGSGSSSGSGASQSQTVVTPAAAPPAGGGGPKKTTTPAPTTALPETSTVAESQVQETTTPSITGGVSFVNSIKENASTLATIVAVVAPAMAGLVLFAKRAGKFPKLKIKRFSFKIFKRK